MGEELIEFDVQAGTFELSFTEVYTEAQKDLSLEIKLEDGQQVYKKEFRVAPGEPVKVGIHDPGTLIAGELATFVASFYDQYDNEVIGRVFQNDWYRIEFPGRDPIVISESGVSRLSPLFVEGFIPTKVGVGAIEICLDGFCDNIRFEIVSGSLVKIQIEVPEEIKVGESLEVLITGFDTHDNKVEGSFDLSVTGPAIDMSLQSTFGKELSIPVGEAEGTLTITATNGNVSVTTEVKIIPSGLQTSTTNYTVGQDDTLWSIWLLALGGSEGTGMDWESWKAQTMQLNGLSYNTAGAIIITPGQVLTLP